MTKKIHLLLFSLFLPLGLIAQEDCEKLSCTSIMVGRKASTDGSVMTSHTCDSWYRTWMKMESEEDYPRDTTTVIYEGLMHNEYPGDMTGVKVKGEIPQVRHTYRFLNTAYPCLNEKQLAMGETTISGRDTLRNIEGMFMIEELQRIALQRCTTARGAIRLIADLVREYGYGDSGECLTIADPNEVWIFEIYGEGPSRKGGVWAAQRIPDDHIGVSANISRIGKIDFENEDNFMASDNVRDVAFELGLWDGKEEFSFWKAYSGSNYQKEFKNYSVRELYIMQQLAPSAGFSKDLTELPVSVKPDKLVSYEDVCNLLASYYEGLDNSVSCRIDSLAKETKPALTNPWMRPDEIKLYSGLLKDKSIENVRTVSVSWCAYSTVIQLRSWLPNEIGGVAWICLDNPGQSPRFPIFAGCKQLPMMLGVCGQHRYREDAALWHFRESNRLATVRWGVARKTMEPAREYYLKKGARELPYVEQQWKSMSDEIQRQEMLDGYTADFFSATVQKWDELYKTYWRQFWSGF